MNAERARVAGRVRYPLVFGVWRFASGVWGGVPEGHRENSPAFQRRGKFDIARVPKGRLNNPHVMRSEIFVGLNLNRPFGTWN